MKTRIILLLLWVTLGAQGQTERQWETYLNEVMTAEDVGTDTWEEIHHLLSELAEHPLNLNVATQEQLEQLPFLSAQQIEELQEYRYHYGPMKSLSELQIIRSLDYSRQRLLSCFVTIPEEAETERFPDLSTIAKYGRNELMATAHVPFYERKGDQNGYLGYPYRHWLKYQLTYGDYLKAGVVGSQDAGEPFFANKNRMGYDFYSYYLQVRHCGLLETAVLGKYRVSMGMGLIINNGFALGKVSMLQNLGRTANVLRAHSSRSAADYLQGAAATVNIAKGLSATGFVSYRAMDATLNNDGTVSTILTSGYHRTEKEMEKKNNLKNTTYGGQVSYRRNGLHAALNLVGTHLNRALNPKASVRYRQYDARGYDFLNVSADYSYTTPHISFNGETALNKQGALATINSLSVQMGNGVSLMALHRYYSYRYTSLYGQSFSDGGEVQNESGAYLGVSWQPSPRLKLMAYTDYAYFPWARYQVSQSSHAWDHLVQCAYQWRHWTLGGRYRLRSQQKDNDNKTALLSKTTHRIRLSADYDNGFTSRTQLDLGFTSFKNNERGLMVSESLGYTHRWLRLNGGLGYFNTQGYDSRVYLYELSPLYTYSFTQFSGEGIRYWFMARANVSQRLMLTAKVGITDYFDRCQIGSNLQQIDASSQTDLDIQIRWKF